MRAVVLYAVLSFLYIAEGGIAKLAENEDCQIIWEDYQQPHCSTHYDEVCVDEEQEECSTEFTRECTTEYTDKCTTEYDTSCAEEYTQQCEKWEEEECTDVVEKQCKTDYTEQCEQVYEDQCHTVQDEKCWTEPHHQCKTHHDEVCRETNQLFKKHCEPTFRTVCGAEGANKSKKKLKRSTKAELGIVCPSRSTRSVEEALFSYLSTFPSANSTRLLQNTDKETPTEVVERSKRGLAFITFLVAKEPIQSIVITKKIAVLGKLYLKLKKLNYRGEGVEDPCTKVPETHCTDIPSSSYNKRSTKPEHHCVVKYRWVCPEDQYTAGGYNTASRSKRSETSTESETYSEVVNRTKRVAPGYPTYLLFNEIPQTILILKKFFLMGKVAKEFKKMKEGKTEEKGVEDQCVQVPETHCTDIPTLPSSSYNRRSTNTKPEEHCVIKYRWVCPEDEYAAASRFKRSVAGTETATDSVVVNRTKRFIGRRRMPGLIGGLIGSSLLPSLLPSLGSSLLPLSSSLLPPLAAGSVAIPLLLKKKLLLKKFGLLGLLGLIGLKKKTEECHQVPDQHCSKVPVVVCPYGAECWEEPHHQCKQVPREVCWEEERELCQHTPRQECTQVSKNRCQQIPHESCWEGPRKSCRKIPGQECKQVPQQKCTKVPNKNCSQVPEEKCWNEPHKKCWTRPHKKCWKEPKQSCGHVNVKIARRVC